MVTDPTGRGRKRTCDERSRLSSFMCQNLSHKLLHNSLIHSSGAISVESKLRKFLLIKTQNEGATIQLEKRESLAAMLGVSVRQLNRALIKLAQQGIIQHKNKTLKVINPVRLSDFPLTNLNRCELERGK